MNIKNIKNRADELLISCKPQLIRLCVIMGLVQLIPTIFSDGGVIASFISLILLIAFIPYTHGYIVSSLKVARNNAQALCDDDAFVGFKRFKELFPTYLLAGVFSFFILFGLTLILTLVIGMIFSSITMPDMMNPQLINDPISALMYFIMSYPSMVLIFILIFIVIIIAMFFVNGYLFAVPYLLEEYHMSGMAAIKESLAFIKGNIMSFLQLELSFLGWIILVSFVQGLVAQLLSFLPIAQMLAGIVAAIATAYLYYPKYIVSKAILFEEIAYYRYNKTQEETTYE